VLSNERRRYVLHYLKQRNGDAPVPLREVVDQVAAWENGTKIDELESDDRKCVYTALKQTHLPRLDKFGVVEYDHLRGEVELTDTAADVQVYLEYVPEDDIPWSQYYLGLSLVCGLLGAAAWLELPLIGGLEWLTLAAIFVGSFLLSSAVHIYTSRKNRLGSDGPLREIT